MVVLQQFEKGKCLRKWLLRYGELKKYPFFSISRVGGGGEGGGSNRDSTVYYLPLRTTLDFTRCHFCLIKIQFCLHRYK